MGLCLCAAPPRGRDQPPPARRGHHRTSSEALSAAPVFVR
ncbi:hypothetical protein STRAU_6467 [Streptomyces aurantiacus JA 4570]|uniref:Uncharacterized protein n=1 Tax=Streptomyces aurantiacus JA 4570 TaxID=1286094 RepID=S3ZPZ4_9ACTN|nr:hypothetical protein STRAU_6467 [Streptomyces aurantiacus JA 4570]